MKLAISDEEIQQARIVLNDHIVQPLCHEGALESLLWCIASQANRWEIASRFIYRLRAHESCEEHEFSSRRVLHNAPLVKQYAHTSGLRFAKGDRFTPAITYFSTKENESWWKEIAVADNDIRKKYSHKRSPEKIKWINNKTFSFWSLCLGNTHLIALDVYVMTQLKRNFAVDLNEDYITPLLRKNEKQRVRKTPTDKDYESIEHAAQNVFSCDERFLLPDGQVDLALVDGVLWWRGANRKTQHQKYLFGSGVASYNMPYASSYSILK